MNSTPFTALLPTSDFGLLAQHGVGRRLQKTWFVSVKALKFWRKAILAKVTCPGDSRPLGYYFRTGNRSNSCQFFLAFFWLLVAGGWFLVWFQLGKVRLLLKEAPIAIGGSFASGVHATGAKFSLRAQRGDIAESAGLNLAYYMWVHRHRPPS